MTDIQPLSIARVLSALSEGNIEVKGLLPWGSNYTFLVDVTHHEVQLPAVYKPARGERPLWDFPDETLFKREAAAYVVCEALSWGFIPPTVCREGPEGLGSVQFFVDADPEAHYFNFSEEQKDQLKPVVAFDVLVNNADRKGGHVFFDRRGVLWAIDHGLCFHVEPKLRTVIWDFAGDPIPDDLLASIRKLRHALGNDSALTLLLLQLLDSTEVTALRRRADRLLRNEVFPSPHAGRNYPWPPL